jgi:hypothetical protein
MFKQSKRLCAPLIGILLYGCSFSYSSESSVKASASPFVSSSEAFESSLSSSRSSQSRKSRYENEVRKYAAEFAASGSTDSVEFYAHLSRLAQEYGISAWDQDKATYVAIGKGLAEADLSRPRYEALRDALSGGDPQRLGYIEEGYR